MLLRILNESPDRDCGECTACCDVIGVSELGKPYYGRCKHLGANCTIYSTRPQTCREYRCAWHRGLLGDSLDRRPDRSGILIDLDQSSETGLLTISVFETIPGALASGKHQFLTEKIRAHKKFRTLSFTDPPVNLYPYGAKIHVTFPIGKEYDWTPPRSQSIQFELVDSNQGRFSGEIAPLAKPKSYDESQP